MSVSEKIKTKNDLLEYLNSGNLTHQFVIDLYEEIQHLQAEREILVKRATLAFDIAVQEIERLRQEMKRLRDSSHYEVVEEANELS